MPLTWRRLLLYFGVPLTLLAFVPTLLLLTRDEYRGSAEFPGETSAFPATVVAVVDYQRIIRDAQATRDIRSQIDERRQMVLEEIAAEEARLHEEDEALGEQRSALSNEEFAVRRREFEADVAQVQRLAQERVRTLDQLSAEALSDVQDALISALEDVAGKRDFNLVLPSDTVLLFSPQIDLTDEVLTRLDQRLPGYEIEPALP